MGRKRKDGKRSAAQQIGETVRAVLTSLTERGDKHRAAGATAIASAAAAPALAGPEWNTLIVDVYRYRHLLRHIHPYYEQRLQNEKRVAPRINGPRVAAVLARLWAHEDLGLPPTSQKSIGVDLNMGNIGKVLEELRSDKKGTPCVKLVSEPLNREHSYQITEEGKRQLSEWLLVHNEPTPYRESTDKILEEIDSQKIETLIDDLKSKVRKIIGV